jgi:hypothetical protein
MKDHTMIKNNQSLITAGLALMFSVQAYSQVVIDNGIAGDGFWEVTVQDAGNSDSGRLNPAGVTDPEIENVLFNFSTLYDNGKNGADGYLSDNTTSAAASTGTNEATSSGTFPGPNGDINWTAVSTIAPGSPIYQVEFQFSTSTTFGDTRIINYLDEDVFGISDNLGVVLGTDGGADFLLLTVATAEDAGVSQGAGYFTANNMTYAGWHLTDFGGFPSTFSIDPGQVTDLASTTDSRFPSDPVYGPDDIVSAFAFDFDPSATTASVVFTLGGSADGARPDEEPRPAPPATPVPVLSPWGLFGLISGMLFIARLGRKKIASKR